MEKRDTVWEVVIFRRNHPAYSQKFIANDLSERLIKNWLCHSEDWVNISDDPLRPLLMPDRSVYFDVLGADGKTLTDDVSHSPEIRMIPFKDRLFAVRLGNPHAGDGRSAFEFVYYKDGATGAYNVYDHDGVVIDHDSGKLTLIETGATFSLGDGVWPWPILYPEKFLTWSQLASITVADDANPLTGLLKNKKDPLAHTLAEQLARKLAQISADWAKDIVEAL